MAFVCSISGTVPEEPVADKYGFVYEKRIIDKHLQASETCPHNNEPLTAAELVPLKVGKIPKPRPATATSLPALIQLMQNEWDSVMLETFTLKQQLETTRQELAQALYQYDASCRVIARLLKERDEARSALANARTLVGAAPAGAAAPGVGGAGPEAMEVERPAAALPAEVTQRMTDTAKGLSAQRKKRQISPSLAKTEDVQSYHLAKNFPGMHSASMPGISCLDLHPTKTNLIVTGGVDRALTVFDTASGKEVAKLAQHSKKVHDVVFHPSESVIVSASADKTAIVWTLAEKSGKPAHTVSVHTDEVTGVSLHPSGDYFVTASLDRTWAFHDLRSGRSVAQVSGTSEGGYRTISFHPDGLLLGTVSADKTVRVWDAKSLQNIVTFSEHTAPVTSISFSENGFYVATAGEDSTVKLWDLRKPKLVNSVSVGSPVSQVNFDLSGVYLAVACQDLQVFAAKTLEHVKTLSDHTSAVTDAKFGHDANTLVSVSMDRSLKIFGK
jgi:pre-mRNA-processing factor 19